MEAAVEKPTNEEQMEPEQQELTFQEKLASMTPEQIQATLKLLEQQLMKLVVSHLDALELVSGKALKDFRFKLRDGRKVLIKLK